MPDILAAMLFGMTIGALPAFIAALVGNQMERTPLGVFNLFMGWLGIPAILAAAVLFFS